ELINDYSKKLFTENNIMTIEYTDSKCVERLAQILDKVRLGKCNLIEEVIIGEDKFMKFSGLAQGEVYTIVLRGATQEILDKVERSIHNTLHVLFQTVQEPCIYYGGVGTSEMLMATAVSQLAEKTLEKKEEPLAIESFAPHIANTESFLAVNRGIPCNLR
ncbi:unnamed protein product, partial [Rotaria sp. Silwood2]